ncbi:histidine phosphatase family protein [Saccharothrix yanglingensis]|uniref:Phosphoglycerate kinase n=1 Tax=Saccharothrix yanglingensis TaxID=659496 RepID=A0ABU0X2V7_9PSEU|nr:histidine phosphatase family protein [Saccharothrix yanglingensis]MDQ2586465.1 phosphoglycerate kinase [Saccharothrix yanglingensis]
MRLLLVRHGESLHRVRDIVSAEHGCPGLTDLGRRQVAALRDRFAAERLRADVLLTSPAARARQTAELLRPALGAPPLVEERGLTELRLGEGEGLTGGEFRARYEPFDLVAEPDRPICPGGETWHGFGSRVRDTLDGLAAAHRGRTVVAATHAGFAVVAFLVLFAVPRPGTGTRVDPGFASVTEWRHDGGTWRLVRLDDTTHPG